jgi:lipoprotein LpqH
VPCRCRGLAVALLSLGALVSCSDGEPAVALPPDAVPPGTAQVKLGDSATGTSDAVVCTPVASSTIIKTGDNAAGTTSTVTNADTLAVASVDIRNIAGFTGSQWTGLQGDAKVHMSGQAYVITGTARGFTADNPSATAMQPFAITVSC